MNYQEYKDAITEAKNELKAAQKEFNATKKKDRRGQTEVGNLGQAKKALDAAKTNVKEKKDALKKFKRSKTKD
jgi:phage-related tail protein